MDLHSFRTLGRSGLIVSPLGLGTMTFGARRWGASGDAVNNILAAYVDAGGNFIDTADVYSAGESERMVGAYVTKQGLRDKLVIATKFTWNLDRGNPNAGGNGRKNIYRALDASLQRLGTDYIDLYWSHFWDMITPVEEVLQTLADLVRTGKIRYFALSDVPAWYATKMSVLAAQLGIPGPIAIQSEYSLVERHLENEHVPCAAECGLGLIPWSSLAGGFLAGKYERDAERSGNERLSGSNPLGDTKFTERNWAILDVLKTVAAEVDRVPAQVALAWALAKPGISSLLLGASKPEQVSTNIAALELTLTASQMSQLDDISALPPAFPYAGFNADVRRSIFGGQNVRGWMDTR